MIKNELIQRCAIIRETQSTVINKTRKQKDK